MSFTTNQKAKDGVKNLKEAGNDFQDAGRSAMRDADSALSSTAQNLSEAAHTAGQEVRKYISNATHRVTDVSNEIEGNIRQKPVQSTAIALAAGVILGMLLRK